jgi:hypothetical protein
LLIKEAMQKKYVDKLKRKHGFVNFAVWSSPLAIILLVLRLNVNMKCKYAIIHNREK